MLRFIRSDVTPPKGWFFTDPDTGFVYNKRYRSFRELSEHVRSYRTQNNLPPIHNFRQVWEAWRCQDRDVRHLCCPVEERIKRTFSQFFRGGKAWFKAVLKGTKHSLVEQTLADKRAAICARCTENRKSIGHSHAQLYSDRFIAQHVGDRKTPYDKDLFTCKICTCILRSKVHFSNELVADSLSASELARLRSQPRDVSTGAPLRCWQVEAYRAHHEKQLQGERHAEEDGREEREEGREEGRQGQEGREEG